MIQIEETVEISIPAGVYDGLKMKVMEKGMWLKWNKWRFSSYYFSRRTSRFSKDSSNNLHYDKYISFSEAVLGTSTEVPTVSGKVKINIKAGTQSGKILRLRGERSSFFRRIWKEGIY